MKYVAFLDTLGFKQKITTISHEEAVDVIKLFNQTVYNLWRDMGLNLDNSVNGRTFSDSVIINSSGDSEEELVKMLKFLIELYKNTVIICDLHLRGGMAFGEFDDLKAVEFDNLAKGLVVGTAFIDAYSMESSHQIKGSRLLFGAELNTRIQKISSQFQTQKVKNDNDGNPIYELKWGDLNFLTGQDYRALNKFIELATKSKWLDHYFGTLETFLIKETDENKNQIYRHIIQGLKSKFKYNDLDNFIEGYLKSEDARYTKKSFLAFLRDHL